MKTEPNWNEKPEGATHYCTVKEWGNPWFKKKGVVLYRFDEIEKHWFESNFAVCVLSNSDFIEIPTVNQQLTDPVVKESLTAEKVVCSKMEPTTWNGQGLPPVGSVCEAKTASGWLKSIILYHGTGQYLGMVSVVFWFNGNENLAWCKEFRPLKTERERWIYAASKTLAKDGRLVSNSALELIYDAGLAKLPD